MFDNLASQNILGLAHEVICIVGPTASGKTALANELAYRLGGEVVSADSMQIYRGMDIGTGKPSASELKVVHYGFNLVDPGEPYSAALFQEFARTCFKDIDANNKTPFLCGGTGFYVRAAIDGYDFPAGEQVGNDVRNRYGAFAREKGAQALWEQLHAKDPASAALIAPNDIKRVIRAFELIEEGTSYARQHESLKAIPQVVPALLIGLAVDAEILNARIDARVDAMMERGLLDEVKCLLSKGLRDSLCASQAIGYKELVGVIEGTTSLDDAVATIKLATHRFGKRQRTWFRKDKRINWLAANELDIEELANKAQTIIAGREESRSMLA